MVRQLGALLKCLRSLCNQDVIKMQSRNIRVVWRKVKIWAPISGAPIEFKRTAIPGVENCVLKSNMVIYLGNHGFKDMSITSVLLAFRCVHSAY